MGRRHSLRAVTAKDPKNPGNQVTGLQLSVTEDFFPPVEELERIEKLCPNFTRELLDLFKSQSAHRQELETAAISGDNRRADRGQVMAFILGLLGIGGGILLALMGKDILGLSAIVGSLGTLLTAFYGGAIIRSFERRAKRKAIEKASR